MSHTAGPVLPCSASSPPLGAAAGARTPSRCTYLTSPAQHCRKMQMMTM